ncbi:hypothetical protein OH708_00825 [Pseudomonas capsici]|uniref:hypothetical protein n=1 Tax=Pseudomonas capsici TaxID=2810614 RepID=UPI0021F1D353|nr:hypothetical protein [Pseudomonas capsici]MCV4286438.1 hypothetical protein [Pseudomonas capsici]
MKLKSLLPNIQTGMLLILSCSVLVLFLKIHTLKALSSTAPTLASFETLAEQQNELQADLDKLVGNGLITLNQYQMDQTVLNEQIQALTQQSMPTSDLQVIRQELLALEAEAEQIKTSLTQLQKLIDARPAAPTSQAVRKTASRQPRLITLPFNIIGLELRGSEAFLSVSPLGSHQLKDVALMRAGDIREGWQVASLEANKVHFIQPDGARQSLDIR